MSRALRADGRAGGRSHTVGMCGLMCAFALLAMPAGVVGCQILVGIPDVSLADDGGAAGDAGDATTRGAGDGSTLDSGRCGPGMDGGRRSGPAMVQVDVARLSATYCIDTTEVTVAQFNAYLDDTQGVLIDPPPVCMSGVASPPPEDNNAAHAGLPVGDVGSCDALSFCRWAGKRLCGAIGDGGSITNDVAKMDTEWIYACSDGEKNLAYPYGDSYEAGVCNLASDGAVPVGSMAGCRGTIPPFDRIVDMVGNDWELVNDVEANGGNIDALGGSYSTTVDQINVAGGAGCLYGVGFNGIVFDNLPSGFRCCADPDPSTTP